MQVKHRNEWKLRFVMKDEDGNCSIFTGSIGGTFYFLISGCYIIRPRILSRPPKGLLALPFEVFVIAEGDYRTVLKSICNSKSAENVLSLAFVSLFSYSAK